MWILWEKIVQNGNMFYIILAIIGLTRNALSFLGKDSTLINQNMVNCYCPLHCNKRVPFSQTNESPMDNHNQTRNPHYRAAGSFFVVGSWVKLLATMVGRWRKKKKMQWLKRVKAVPFKKRKLDQNINDSKSHNLEFFLWKYFFGYTTFLFCPDVPVDIIKVCL